jgi:AraC-like DNA-binding protein
MIFSTTPSREDDLLVRDSLGCGRHELLYDHSLTVGGMTFRRKTAMGPHVARMETPPEDRGLLIGLSLRAGHRRRSVQGGAVRDEVYGKDGTYIRDFENPYACDVEGSFDFFLLELNREFLAEIANRGESRRLPQLTRLAAQSDPVLGHLAQALLPALADPKGASPLLAEQIGTAMVTHLFHSYGTEAPRQPRRVPRLAAPVLRRATEMLMEESGPEVSMATIADALNMSRGQFFRAFRETTGTTPYQWVLNQRLDHARQMLRTTDLPLAQIALHCGFFDQSHLTRIFSREMGVSPGRWRRESR